MAHIPRPTLNKIPGGGMPIAKQDSHHVKDMTKLTRVELLEIKEREGKLLDNKTKLDRLPDKGQRIQNFYDRVTQELQRRTNVDEAAIMFSELNIASKGESVLNQLEWNYGATVSDGTDPCEDVLDSDDESEMDPLRILAQRNMHERKLKVLPPEPILITPKDLEEIESFNNDSKDLTIDEVVTIDVGENLSAVKPEPKQITKNLQTSIVSNSLSSGSRCSTPEHGQDLEQHVRYLVGMSELPNATLQRERFKPYKTTISNVHDPEKEKQRKKGKNWEVTAATPPLIQNSATKLLNLMDSMEIQSNYLAKLKELQEKQAAERLAIKIERLESRNMELPSAELLKTKKAFNSYRSPANKIEGEQHSSEAEEIHDLLDEEKSAGVIHYTVYE